MRRAFILAIVVALLVPVVSVQGEEGQPLGWAQSAGGFDDEILAGHVILDDNTVIVAGEYTSAATFGDDGFGATGFNGDTDMFVAKLDSNGNWTSAFGFGGNGADGIDAIALHSSGDIILGGHFCIGTAGEACEVNITSQNLVKEDDSGEGDAFIGRFSYTNNTFVPIWVRTISNINDLSVFDISVSPNGGISAGIFHRGAIEIESEIIPGSNGISIGILHYDENGQLEWSNGISSPQGIEPFGGMCYSSDGFLHVAGTFIGSVMFVEMETSSGEADMFAAQLDGDGNFTWTSFAGGTGDDWVNDCAIDSDGKMHIVGQFERTAEFGFQNVTSSGWWDMFHATLTTNGAWNSVSRGGGGGWESIESIAIDSRDNILVLGTYTANFTLGLDNLVDWDSNGDKRDIFLAQLDSNYQWEWAISAGGSGDDTARSLQLGENESPVAGLHIQNTVQLSNFTLTAAGSDDIAFWNYARDHDSDGLTDGTDNCPRVANPDQQDTDGDLSGDACDDDDDGDSVGDDWDDCNPGETGWISAPNTDHDSDGCRDALEDLDDDEDGILDDYDNCPKGPVGWTSTIENDEDQDGCEDVDTDGDGFVDQLDVCPAINDDQADLDNDGIGDACESDTDGDGIEDEFDNCVRDTDPWESEHSIDHDQDGCQDENRDADDDDDGVLDLSDDCPLGEINWNSSFDHDNDGCHDDIEDDDDDSDGFMDSDDNCPRGYIGLSLDNIHIDFDQDGCFDSMEDNDDDGDGVVDTSDDCSYTLPGMEVDSNGCSGDKLDDDGDGVHNLNDLCPATTPGDIVSSTGCTVVTIDEGKGQIDEDSSSSLTWVFFAIAGELVVIALIVTFKPQKPLPTKTLPSVTTEQSTVDDGGSQGDGSVTSADVDDTGLDVDSSEPQVATDEIGSDSEDVPLVE
ncbi:MAG: hypothetical protein HOE76_00900 [Euryarchaeota archaeon]|nr:hypothetical protein [Euryarchaeota archaeon]